MKLSVLSIKTYHTNIFSKHFRIISSFKKLFPNQYLATFEESGNLALFDHEVRPTHSPSAFETKSQEYCFLHSPKPIWLSMFSFSIGLKIGIVI